MDSDEFLILAALQIEPSDNLTDTFSQIQELTDQVFAEEPHIDCLVLPEYTFGTFREWNITETDRSELLEDIHLTISELAKNHRVSIVAGSTPHRTEENHWRNRSSLFTPSGSIMGSYDKQHPFRAEKQLGLEPGTSTPVFRVGNNHLAILICSDLWFHDLVIQVADKVDFLAVPTMTTVLNHDHLEYGRWVWQSLVAVRAKEYTIPIVSADQASREYAPGVFTCGGTCIADPSYRFDEKEGPFTQALKTTATKATGFVINKIPRGALNDYARYRQDVGLREEKRV